MPDHAGCSRRDVFKLAAAVGLGGGAAGLLADTPPADVAKPGAAPRNIILMVSDGMSLGVPSLAEAFSHVARQRGTAWARLLTTPGVVHGLFDTSSLNSLVTDSAAASSAWGSGSRVFNGALNVLPDGTRLTPIGVLTRDSGRRVGLVTTTRITHATPAGVAAVQPSRDDENDIAPQYVRCVDVLLGGGRKHFAPGERNDGRDVLREYADAGFTVWTHRSEVSSGPRPDRVLGLFDSGHLPYVIDVRNTPELTERIPTLAELSAAAIDILARSERGYLLQIEGGRVDHAAHANDAAALLWEQLSFDDALDTVLHLVSERDDTLLIVTSDHGNSNPGLNGMGDDYRDSPRCLERVVGARASFAACEKRLGGRPSRELVADVLRASTGVELSSTEIDAVHAALTGADRRAVLNRQQSGWAGVLGQALSNHFGIGWTGTTHTQDWVLVSAIGPGAQRFTGLRHHVAWFAEVAGLWGIRHQNPEMSAEEAARFAGRVPGVAAAHWA